MTGTIILWATIALLVAFGIVLLTYGRRWKLPPGPRSKASFRGHEVILIGDPFATAHDCARAVWATYAMAGQKRGWRVPGELFVVVHAADDDTYDRLYNPRAPQRSNGMLLTVRRKWLAESSAPLVAVRASSVPSREAFGGLVIHEMVHEIARQALGNPGRKHADEELWCSERDALECEAYELFRGGVRS